VVSRPDFTRRAAIAVALTTGIAACFLSADASAQSVLTKGRQVSFICAFPPGSGADVQVRYLAEKVAAATGMTVVVENKPGAAGNIAAEHVVRSKPDGATVYVHSGTATAGNMHLLAKPPFDVRTSLQAVASISTAPFVLTVDAKSPFKSVQELTAHLKAQGAKASYASSSTSGKVMGEIYKQRAGLETVEVSYRTGQDAMNDMLGGNVAFSTDNAAFSFAQQRNGRVRVLAVSSAERMKAAPEIPTMKEQGVEMDQLGWWGAFVAAGTPEPIVNEWNAVFAKVLNDPATVEFHKSIGADILIASPKDTQDRLRKSVDEWEEFVRIAKIPKN